MSVLKGCAGLLIVAFFTQCQTIPVAPDALPARVERAFSTCTPTEGSLSFRAVGENFQKSFEIDWVSRNMTFEMHMSDPFGVPVLNVLYSGTVFSVKGALAPSLPEIDKVGEVLRVGDTVMPFGIDELSCFLAYRMPIKWKGLSANSWRMIGNSIVSEFSVGSYAVVLSFDEAGGRWKSCAQYYRTWIGWIRSAAFKVCYKDGQEGTASNDKGLFLEWRPLNGSPES